MWGGGALTNPREMDQNDVEVAGKDESMMSKLPYLAVLVVGEVRRQSVGLAAPMHQVGGHNVPEAGPNFETSDSKHQTAPDQHGH